MPANGGAVIYRQNLTPLGRSIYRAQHELITDDVRPLAPAFIGSACSGYGLDGPGCKFNWREPVKARVWSFQIVIASPSFDDVSGVSEAAEQMLVQAFIAQPPVKAFDKTVLHRLAWLDGMAPLYHTPPMPLFH